MPPLPTSRPASSSIGLDIGSNAVRAVELARTRKGIVCRRFAQVGLPRGAVVDGEIAQPQAVANGLRRLWAEGGFTERRVVLSVSAQRVIVRQAEVMAMSEGDFRSALSYQAMDLIPIPVDDAVIDFCMLPKDPDRPLPPERMEILLAAAHRQVIDGHLAVLREAGLRAAAIDPAPMALVRASQRAGVGAGRTVAVVDIGAELTIVALRENGVLRFSRILNGGGRDLTDRVAERLGVVHEEAESLKRMASSAGGPGGVLVAEVAPLVTEIESSMTYFASQLGTADLEEVWLSGGPSHSPELVSELARRLPIPVALLDPLASLDVAALEAGEGGHAGVLTSALVAIGAAQWAFEPSASRLSLVPGEFAAAAARRRAMGLTAASVAGLAAALALVGLSRDHQVSQAQKVEAAAQAANTRTTAQIAALAPAQAKLQALQAHLALIRTASQDNVAWPILLDRISAAMPAGTHVNGVSFADNAGSTSSSSTSSSTPASSTSASGSLAPAKDDYGSVTMQVVGPPSEKQVAVWLDALRGVPGLTDVWIPSASIAQGKVTFTSSATVDAAAPMVVRSIPKGARQ